MSAEWVTAIATAGTFVVIAASAIAALLQLRHVRGSNQIAALTECRETLESPDFRKAQSFVSYELPKRLADPSEWQKITRLPFQGEYEDIVTVANFFESLGAFVRNGIIDRRIACDLWYGVVLRNWNALLPVTTYVRRAVGRGLWENFEYLAALSQRYDDTYPEGTYPTNLPRMPEDPSLVEAISAQHSDGVAHNG
jgi:hypothetical protein